jgi:hypothetical protein
MDAHSAEAFSDTTLSYPNTLPPFPESSSHRYFVQLILSTYSILSILRFGFLLSCDHYSLFSICVYVRICWFFSPLLAAQELMTSTLPLLG